MVRINSKWEKKSESIRVAFEKDKDSLSKQLKDRLRSNHPTSNKKEADANNNTMTHKTCMDTNATEEINLFKNNDQRISEDKNGNTSKNYQQDYHLGKYNLRSSTYHLDA